MFFFSIIQNNEIAVFPLESMLGWSYGNITARLLLRNYDVNVESSIADWREKQ